MTIFYSDFLRDPANYSAVYLERLLDMFERYPELKPSLENRHALSPLLLPVGLIFTETKTGREMPRRIRTGTLNAIANGCMGLVLDLCRDTGRIHKYRQMGEKNTLLVQQCLKEFLILMKIDPKTVQEQIAQLKEKR